MIIRRHLTWGEGEGKNEAESLVTVIDEWLGNPIMKNILKIVPVATLNILAEGVEPELMLF